MSILLGIGSCLSRLINVLTGGTSDMTFSARSYRDGLWTTPVIDFLFLMLAREPDHCARWYYQELERSRQTLEQAGLRVTP